MENLAIPDLPPELQRALTGLGIERLTPIQAQTLPLLRAGRDVVGESQTGSGKTIAFALPMLEKIRTEGRQLQALVLCPTRELCRQVATTVRLLGRFKRDLLVTTVVGGEPGYLQLRSLAHGVHVVVGTPGRVGDFLGRGKLDLSAVHTVVLDEADRMLDMGFRDAVEAILQSTPPARQTVLFSATFPQSIAELSARCQRVPARVVIAAAERPAIRQIAYAVEPAVRTEGLVRLLQAEGYESALVFCNLKATVDELTQVLRAAGLRADKIHGDLEQRDRDAVMARFRNLSTRILVATDVAARGLDIAGLDAVFNFELAKDAPTHVHRIGRTGRAGKPGLAVTFYLPSEAARFQALEKALGYPIPDGETTAAREAGTVTDATTLVSTGDATATSVVAHRGNTDWETIEISGGRKAKLRPGDILGALTGEAGGLPGSAIGKIEIQDHVSYIAVERSVARRALKSLQAGKVKGRRFLARIVQ